MTQLPQVCTRYTQQQEGAESYAANILLTGRTAISFLIVADTDSIVAMRLLKLHPVLI